MKWKSPDLPTYLNIISALILMVGLGSAALIYQRAGNVPYSAWGYEIMDGNIYPIMPQDSKMYRHNLELYGGKLNVIMDDFNRWFTGLWHGKSLAVILGFTAILISFGFYYAANHFASGLKSDVQSENNRNGTD
jgi:hypothetical protein